MDLLSLIAQTAPAQPEQYFPASFLMQFLGWVTTFVVAVIGAAYARKAREKGREEGKQAVTIADQPLMVKMEERFVTREDFREFKADTKQDLGKLEGLFHATMTKVDERDRAMTIRIEERDRAMSEKIETRDEKLSASIDKVSKGAYEARGRMHVKINDHGERLKSLEDRQPVKRGTGGH